MARTATPGIRPVPQVNNALFVPPDTDAGLTPKLTPPADNRFRAESDIQWIPASLIGRDERVNTRPVDETWVTARVKEFDWNVLGTITVSRRGDGTFIALDGQHRVALVAAVGQPDADVKCEVFNGLTIAQEAELFIGLNAGRVVKPVSKFLARVTMGDPIAAGVLEAAEDCGWLITPAGGRGALQCVNTMTKLHARDLARCKGGEKPQALREALTLIIKAYGHKDGAGHETIVAGVGTLMVRDDEIIRDDLYQGIPGMDRMVDILRSYGTVGDPSPLALHEQARSYSSSRIPKVGMTKSVAQTLVNTWNYKRQSGRLAPFVKD